MGKLLQNFTTWKGNYREIAFFVEDVVSVESANAAEWGMSVSESSPKLIHKTLAASQITLSGQIVTVILNPEDTDDDSGIEAGTYYHELRLVDGDGNPSTPAIGTVTLRAVILPGEAGTTAAPTTAAGTTV